MDVFPLLTRFGTGLRRIDDSLWTEPFEADRSMRHGGQQQLRLALLPHNHNDHCVVVRDTGVLVDFQRHVGNVLLPRHVRLAEVVSDHTGSWPESGSLRTPKSREARSTPPECDRRYVLR